MTGVSKPSRLNNFLRGSASRGGGELQLVNLINLVVQRFGEYVRLSLFPSKEACAEEKKQQEEKRRRRSSVAVRRGSVAGVDKEDREDAARNRFVVMSPLARRDVALVLQCYLQLKEHVGVSSPPSFMAGLTRLADDVTKYPPSTETTHILLICIIAHTFVGTGCGRSF
jgi:hypothetical protein